MIQVLKLVVYHHIVHQGIIFIQYILKLFFFINCMILLIAHGQVVEVHENSNVKCGI